MVTCNVEKLTAALISFKPRTITRTRTGRLFRPSLVSLSIFGISQKSLDDNGGAQRAGDVPHRRKDAAKAAARRSAIERLPKAMPLKERKKLLARKLAARRRH